jgi:hypothetical protein
VGPPTSFPSSRHQISSYLRWCRPWLRGTPAPPVLPRCPPFKAPETLSIFPLLLCTTTPPGHRNSSLESASPTAVRQLYRRARWPPPPFSLSPSSPALGASSDSRISLPPAL